MGIKIEVHSVDDWEAIYVDGKCEGQDHSGMLKRYLENHLFYDSFNDSHHPLVIDSLEIDYHEDDHISKQVEEFGRFPEYFSSFDEAAKEAEIEALGQKVDEIKKIERALEVLRAEVTDKWADLDRRGLLQRRSEDTDDNNTRDTQGK